MCKLHNGVFKAAESRINTESLPLARGDESFHFGLFQDISEVCPSQEGMNRLQTQEKKKSGCLPLARGDDSAVSDIKKDGATFAPRGRGFFGHLRLKKYTVQVCPS